MSSQKELAKCRQNDKRNVALICACWICATRGKAVRLFFCLKWFERTNLIIVGNLQKGALDRKWRHQKGFEKYLCLYGIWENPRLCVNYIWFSDDEQKGEVWRGHEPGRICRCRFPKEKHTQTSVFFLFCNGYLVSERSACRLQPKRTCKLPTKR